MNDVDRVARMREHATALKQEGRTAMAYDLEKFARFVLDRDAGASDALKAENTMLASRIENLEARLANALTAAEEARLLAATRERAVEAAAGEIQSLRERLAKVPG